MSELRINWRQESNREFESRHPLHFFAFSQNVTRGQMAKSKKHSRPPAAGRQRARGGTRGTVYLQLSIMRLKDANVLLENRRYAGAIYLAGYAIECRLKWAVTQRNQIDYLPAEYEIHELDRLLIAAGLQSALKKAGQIASHLFKFCRPLGAGVALHAFRSRRREGKSPLLGN